MQMTKHGGLKRILEGLGPGDELIMSNRAMDRLYPRFIALKPWRDYDMDECHGYYSITTAIRRTDRKRR